MKNWWIGVVAIIALGAIMFLSDRKVQTPSGIDFIRNDNQYAEVNNRAAVIAYPVFERVDAGGDLTEDDKAKLREALPYFEAMGTYNPTRVKTFFGAGKCFMLIGEKQKAAERFEQAVLNKRIDKDPAPLEMQATAYEAAGLLAEVTMDLAAEEIANFNSLSQANDMVGAEAAKKRSLIYYQKALESANIAVEGVPNAARYLAIRANVYLALKKEDLAKKDIIKAKGINPDDYRVKMTAKMLGV